MADQLLTVAELAGRLRVSKSTAYGLVREPGFPAVRIGRQIRIPTDELRAWLAGRRLRSEAPDLVGPPEAGDLGSLTSVAQLPT